jgi:hypothetical protein
MYRLYDTFNKCTISRHRTVKAVALADKRFQRRVREGSGADSYLPTTILDADYQKIPQVDYEYFLAVLSGEAR